MQAFQKRFSGQNIALFAEALAQMNLDSKGFGLIH